MLSGARRCVGMRQVAMRQVAMRQVAARQIAMLQVAILRVAVLHLGVTIATIGIPGQAIAKAAPAPAAERILDDSGGRIGTYLNRYEALRKSGQHVMIDGTCASACTLLLGVIPHSRICVTPRAVLAFHAAWDPSLTGAQTNKPGTKYLWSHYPDAVRQWIARHGGLRSQTIYLGGRELTAMFSTCR